MRDSEVCISTFDGVLRDILGYWIFATVQFAVFPYIEVDAAQSKYAVSLFRFGGLAQPGGSS